MPEKKNALKIDPTKPQGKITINICGKDCCFPKNSGIVKSVEGKLGIKPGEATPDGKIYFELTECIDACGKSPAMKINDVIHVNLTLRTASKILNACK